MDFNPAGGTPALPDTFAGRMASLPGLDTESFLEAMRQPAAVSVRLNGRKQLPPTGSCRGIAEAFRLIAEASATPAASVPWCPTGLYLPSRPTFTLDPLLHAGAYYVQDASSMIYRHIVAWLLARPEMPAAPRVLDLCAAPGGKTTAMLDALPDGALLVANEYVPARAAVLRENLLKWGCPDVIVTRSDAQALGAAGQIFDIMAVDAPCSGEGMMRKEAAAVSQWSPGLVASCAALQRDILDDALPALRPGGYLIYSTCTFNLEENERMVQHLADTYGLVPVEVELPSGSGILPALEGRWPCMRFMPHATRGEGLFAAVLRRPDDDTPPQKPAPRPARKRRKGDSVRNTRQADPEPLRRLLLDADNYVLSVTDGEVSAISRRWEATLHDLESAPGLRLLNRGVPLGVTKGHGYAPRGELMLSTAYSRDALPYVDLELPEALAFLRRDAISLPPATPRGHVAVGYGGLPLGAVNNLGNRSNNLYPPEWRIRIRTGTTD